MINYNIKLSTKDQNIHFISDLHYNHDRDFIWGAPGRKYKNVTDMNQDIIHQWNAYVSPNDIVFHLGDIIFNDYDGLNLLKLFNRLNFKRLYCLFGNHVSGEKHIYRELMKDKGLDNCELFPVDLDITQNKKVTYLGYHVEIHVNGQKIILNHYPIDSWNGQRKGAYMVHGHCHCNLYDTNMKRIDVGWDYMNRPVSFKDLQKIMETKTRLTAGDHHK